MMVTLAGSGPSATGIIVSEVNLRDMWNLVDQIVVGRSGYAFVTSGEGVLIAHPDKTIVLKGAQAPTECAGGYKGPGVYVGRRSPGDHPDILAARAPVHGTDWTVVLQQPLSEAYLPVRMTFIFAAAPLFFVFFLLILRFTFLKKRIITPLERLVEYARTVRGGNTDVAAPAAIDDEIGLLTSALSGMVARLKERTRSLERSEHEYKMVTDGVGEVIFALDGSGCFVFLNRRIAEITGHQTSDLLGRPFLSIVSDTSMRRVNELVDDIMKGVESQSAAVIVLTALDGRQIEADVALMRNKPSGETIRTFGIARDITETKRTEQMHRVIFEQSPVGIQVHGTDGQLTDVNRASQRILAVADASEMKQLNLFRCPYLDDEQRGRLTKRQPVKTMISYDLEQARKLGLFTTEGTGVVELEVLITPLQESSDETARGYLVQLQDISEIKRLQKALVQSQKMEAIGTLAGGIAHDFNNILGIISGYTEMALYDLPDVAEVERELKQVQIASGRAASLVKQILDFSRESQGELIPIHVGGIIEEVLKLLRSSLPTTIEIRCLVETKEDTILADSTQIHQVLMNLATNAGHALREKGGVLDIVLTDVDVDADTHPDLLPGSYLKLTVSDTGHGMSQSVVERIFDPYYTTKKKGEGTGLGLSVAHGIIKSIGGAIAVGSTPGKGSSFQIILPKVKSGTTENGKTSQEILRGSEKILLIDDEAELAKMTRKMLENLGYTVTAQTDGLEALELFRRDTGLFDLVITDQIMPRITGIELSRALLHIRPDIPIILCSGFKDQSLEEQIETAGISEFVMKPLTIKGFADVIRKAVQTPTDS